MMKAVTVVGVMCALAACGSVSGSQGPKDSAPRPTCFGGPGKGAPTIVPGFAGGDFNLLTMNDGACAITLPVTLSVQANGVTYVNDAACAAACARTTDGDPDEVITCAAGPVQTAILVNCTANPFTPTSCLIEVVAGACQYLM